MREAVKNSNLLCTCSHVRLSKTTFSRFSSHTVNSVLFLVYSIHIFRISRFLLMVSLFKMAPSTVLKCCLGSLSARRLGCALWRKYMHEHSFLRACVILLAARSMLMNRRHILNIISLNRNTPKTKLHIGLTKKCCDQRLSGT